MNGVKEMMIPSIWINGYNVKAHPYRRTPKEIHRKKVINGEKLTARSSN